jgi:hypothetical protein
MIYGIIPVGGKGVRLSLPYPKEMLPQKNFDYYNPVINHTVEKMFMAGAGLIYMVHGREFKKEIVEYYAENSKIIHITQDTPSFSGVLQDFYEKVNYKETDKILFGLPDSIYDKNPFIEMLNIPGIVCGLFISDNNIKADRPSIEDQGKFQVKVAKDDTNLDYFWGVLKFDGENLTYFVKDECLKNHSEIGDILNVYKKTYVYGKDYVDLGTWMGYNKYLNSTKNFSNTEVEKKYFATNVDIDDFNEFCYSYMDVKDHYSVKETTDYYFTNNNSNIEFIRYRDSGADEPRNPNITIKNFNNSQFNRFELTIPVHILIENTEDILHFMSLMGAKFNFSVKVDAYIYTTDDCDLVIYSFYLGSEKVKLIEIELSKMDFNIISKFENLASFHLKGFNASNSTNKSKFQIIKEYYDKS